MREFVKIVQKSLVKLTREVSQWKTFLFSADDSEYDNEFRVSVHTFVTNYIPLSICIYNQQTQSLSLPLSSPTFDVKKKLHRQNISCRKAASQSRLKIFFCGGSY